MRTRRPLRALTWITVGFLSALLSCAPPAPSGSTGESPGPALRALAEELADMSPAERDSELEGRAAGELVDLSKGLRELAEMRRSAADLEPAARAQRASRQAAEAAEYEVGIGHAEL
ncbi:MAG: hypothetical protein AAGM22_31375 [Acidobacteriota bacterium]